MESGLRKGVVGNTELHCGRALLCSCSLEIKCTCNEGRWNVMPIKLAMFRNVPGAQGWGRRECKPTLRMP